MCNWNVITKNIKKSYFTLLFALLIGYYYLFSVILIPNSNLTNIFYHRFTIFTYYIDIYYILYIYYIYNQNNYDKEIEKSI